jgi:hypothetical protein
MGTKYDLLKVVTIAGTVFSIYNAYADRLVLGDLIIVGAIAIAIVAIAKDFGKAKKAGDEKAMEKNGLQKNLTNTIKEIIAEELA